MLKRPLFKKPLRPGGVLLLLGTVLICLSSAALSSAASAQNLRLGTVLSLSGETAHTGLEQLAALELATRDLERRGVRLELQVRDDRSEPQRAAAHAAALAESGVHALVCCSGPRTAAAVQSAGLPLPTLLLSPPAPLSADGTGGAERGAESSVGAGANRWVFSLMPSAAQQLARVAQEVRAGTQSAALMAPSTAAGDTAAAVLGSRLGEQFVGEARYPGGAERSEPLTPEALWVATREPGVVVVWGERAADAVYALAARGYTGTLYLESDTLKSLNALGRARLGRTGTGINRGRVQSVISPFELGTLLPSTHPSASAGAGYRRVAALSGGRSSLAGAYAWDAAQLFGAALEQTLAYGLSLGSNASTAPADRQGLRDGLLGLEPSAGASGVLDLQSGAPSAVDAASLVVGVWRQGALRPPSP